MMSELGLVAPFWVIVLIGLARHCHHVVSQPGQHVYAHAAHPARGAGHHDRTAVRLYAVIPQRFDAKDRRHAR